MSSMAFGSGSWGLHESEAPGLTRTSYPSPFPARSTLPLKQEEYEVSVSFQAGGRQRGRARVSQVGVGAREARCQASTAEPHLHPAPRQAFLLKLVQNLFAEGNDLFREKDYKQALVQYMEGLNVADYAASDQVALPQELLCKLHVNRAACYFTMVSAPPALPLLCPPPPTASPRCPAEPGQYPSELLQGRLPHVSPVSLPSCTEHSPAEPSKCSYKRQKTVCNVTEPHPGGIK